MSHWYYNQATTYGGSSKLIVITQPAKKPHATNAEELFTKSHQKELQATASSKMKQDCSTAPGGNLIVYHKAKKKAVYSDLSRAERLEWETLAKAHNNKNQGTPSMDYIFEYA